MNSDALLIRHVAQSACDSEAFELRSGRTILQDASDGPQLEVIGTQIKSGRDCLRDNEWQVYKICIRNRGKKSVQLLASKAGGDVAKISAPIEMHGSEEDDFRRDLVGCSTTASFTFQCSVLSVSDSHVQITY